jgi:hypothetical protein
MASSTYKIPEISYKDYVGCLEGIYTVLEGKHTSKGCDDVFMRSILAAHSGMSASAWLVAEKQRRYEKALTMKMGDFHEELAGKFPGYKTLKLGDETGCDVQKSDGSEIWEFKNRDNTMNSSSAESVMAKLAAEAAKGKKAFLVLVNCEKKTVPRLGAPASVTVLNGRQAYEYLSKRPTFFDDLQSTLAHTFATYPTYASLLATI